VLENREIRMRLLAATGLLAVAPCAAGAFAGEPTNLVRNGGFEEGATHECRLWQNVWPKSVMKQAPSFDRSRANPREGSACALLTTTEGGGFSAFWQTISAPPAGAKAVRLEGWIDPTDTRPEAGAPSIAIVFDLPKSAGSDVICEAKLPIDATGWTRVSVAAEVPAAATAWRVRCGILGVGTVRFDDVRLTPIFTAVESVDLIAAHGDYLFEAATDAHDRWLEFSLPFPFEGQTPLAVRITTEPPGLASSVAIVSERENRFVRVSLDERAAGNRTNVRLDALVLVRDRKLGNGEGVALTARSKLPKEVAATFEPTPGIDATDEGIRAVARDFRKATLAELAEDLDGWMRENVHPGTAPDQGGRATFERKFAACTGQANLAASLLQAADVPCRMLGCLMGKRLQEHYIVEVWTASEGWRRIESTLHAFPIADSMHLILHVADPPFHRSAIHVPLKIDAAEGCKADFRMGEDHCWQGMSRVASLALDPPFARELERAARAAFESWRGKPSASPSIRLAPAISSAPAKVGDTGIVASKLEAFLSERK
jgi:transglutaminase superfamily protein